MLPDKKWNWWLKIGRVVFKLYLSRLAGDFWLHSALRCFSFYLTNDFSFSAQLKDTWSLKQGCNLFWLESNVFQNTRRCFGVMVTSLSCDKQSALIAFFVGSRELIIWSTWVLEIGMRLVIVNNHVWTLEGLLLSKWRFYIQYARICFYDWIRRQKRCLISLRLSVLWVRIRWRWCYKSWFLTLIFIPYYEMQLLIEEGVRVKFQWWKKTYSYKVREGLP